MDSIVREVEEKCAENGVNLLYLCKFGSHLYGTDTSESDTDYKGIFLPSKKQCFLQTCPKNMNVSTGSNDSRNTKEDVDISLWSLQYFLQLVSKGETNALDLLFSQTHEDCIVYCLNKMWDVFDNYNKLFDIKNCNSFIYYSKNQVKKYGSAATRLGVLKRVYEYIDGVIERLSSEERLPENITSVKLDSFLYGIEQAFYDPSYCFIKKVNGMKSIVLCGKVHNSTITLQEFYERIKKEYKKYGQRVIDAYNNKNVDWKAVSHAIRCLIQMELLLRDGKITFPLNEAEYLLRVKKGEFDFSEVDNVIMDKLQIVEKMQQDTTINIKKQQSFIEKLILNMYL